MAWEDHFNIAELPAGNYRSIAGYASESLVIGRALQCGYNLFFKAWRDSPYDGVLDYQGILFRVEIKGTRAGSISVTSGGRTGAQIDRGAGSREHIIKKEDVDILLGVDNLNGDCYLIPSEVLGIFNNKTLKFSKIVYFKEKWGILKNRRIEDVEISTQQIKVGFMGKSETENAEFARSLGIPIPTEEMCRWEWPGFRARTMKRNEVVVLEIWKKLFQES